MKIIIKILLLVVRAMPNQCLQCAVLKKGMSASMQESSEQLGILNAGLPEEETEEIIEPQATEQAALLYAQKEEDQDPFVF